MTNLFKLDLKQLLQILKQIEEENSPNLTATQRKRVSSTAHPNASADPRSQNVGSISYEKHRLNCTHQNIILSAEA